MVISNKLKQRFCKDCKIPISVYDEPYFSERLELYDKFYNSKEKWNVFLNEVTKYDCDQDYFEEYNRVKEQAMSSIKESDAFKRFNNEDMNKFSVRYSDLPTKDIYKESNVNKLFISIDMKKANFSALQHYDSNMFGNSETWEDFIGEYTNNKHIINSKYIRQVVLGNCNPRRQVTYEKYLMGVVLSHIKKYNLEDKVVFFSNDEIVFGMSNDDVELKLLLYMCRCLQEDINEDLNIPCRVELFKLLKINGTDGYLKEVIKNISDREYKIKCLDGYMFPFVLRRLQNQEITENDKVFIHEGLLSKFIEIPKIEVNNIEC